MQKVNLIADNTIFVANFKKIFTFHWFIEISNLKHLQR